MARLLGNFSLVDISSICEIYIFTILFHLFGNILTFLYLTYLGFFSSLLNIGHDDQNRYMVNKTEQTIEIAEMPYLTHLSEEYS